MVKNDTDDPVKSGFVTSSRLEDIEYEVSDYSALEVDNSTSYRHT